MLKCYSSKISHSQISGKHLIECKNLVMFLNRTGKKIKSLFFCYCVGLDITHLSESLPAMTAQGNPSAEMIVLSGNLSVITPVAS